MRSDWTEAISGSTDAPPPAVPLDVPSGLSVTDRDRDALTLGWNSVLGAATYQVQQKIDDAAWSSASCGGADNQVDGTECVASGLTAGTEYDFRVRAAPAADDTATLAVSSWSSTASATTTGRAAVSVEDGGLDLQWTSEGNTITWIWDPVEDRTLQPLVDSYVSLLTPTVNQCPSLDQNPEENFTNPTPGQWVNMDSATSASLNVADAGETRGLCVVRTWEDERNIRQFGDVSVAWATTVPSSGSETTNPQLRQSTTARTTTSITWHYVTDEGFDYTLRVLTVSRDGDAPNDDSDCSGGEEADSPPPANKDDVPASYRKSDPDSFAYYRLCARAENDDGASEWTFIGAAATETRPAAPSAPTYVPAESEVTKDKYGADEVLRMVWSVEGSKGTPRNSGSYDVKVFQNTKGGTVSLSDVQDVCKDATTRADTDITEINTNSGFDFEVMHDTNLVTPDPTDLPGLYYMYACVRADPDETTESVADNDSVGAWSISAPRTFVAGQPTRSVVGLGQDSDNATNTASKVYFAWEEIPGATSYEVQYAQLDDDGDVDDDSPGVVKPRSLSTASYTITITAQADKRRYSLRVRYLFGLDGRTLKSEWSDPAALIAAAPPAN